MPKTFKYPVGAEVTVKRNCDHGEFHRSTAFVLATFVFTDNNGMAQNFYALHVPVGASAHPFCMSEDRILGRVNVRSKNGDDET
jgi:hypothetical protein